MLFQLQLSGTGLRDCQEWVVSTTFIIGHDLFAVIYLYQILLCLQGIDRNAKLNDITNAVVQSINQHCQCGLSAECITEGAFQCFERPEQQVTFRARICDTAQTNTSLLLAYLETFVTQTDSTIAVQGVRLEVDSSCSVIINSFGDPQCTMTTASESTTTMAGQSENSAAIIVGGVVAVIVVIIVAVTVIIIAFLITRSHRAKFSVPQDVG